MDCLFFRTLSYICKDVKTETMNVKRIFLIVVSAFALSGVMNAQVDPATAAKRERHRNMTIKEWNTDARTQTRWMDRMTVYDEAGRKIEEAEYANYGQKWRITYEYGENDKIAKEVLYDDRDKPVLIRKYEYDSTGRKLKQYNYAPNGRLQTTKVFEYIMP